MNHPKARKAFSGRRSRFRNIQAYWRQMEPIDFMMLFFPLSLYRLITKFSRAKFDAEPPQSETNAKRWRSKTPTLETWVRFFGIQLYMSIHCLPHYRLYWKAEPSSGPSSSPVVSTSTGISLSMYELMRRYITAEDPAVTKDQPKRGDDFHDPLHRVRRIHDRLNDIFAFYIIPGETFSLDEAMVGCKLRCFLIVTVKNKPSPTGIRIWVLADSRSGYALRFCVDAGLLAKQRPWCKTMQAVVHAMCDGLKAYTRVYSDRLFGDIPTTRFHAVEKNVFFVSPLKVNRKHLPFHKEGSAVPGPSVHALKSKDPAVRGRIKILATDGGLTQVYSWQDTGLVVGVASGHAATGGFVKRHTIEKNRNLRKPGVVYDGTKQVVPAPPAMVEYNRHMGGVDLFDRFRGGRYAVAKRFVTYKWNHKLIVALFGMAKTNAYIAWRSLSVRDGPGQGKHRHYHFVSQLCAAMMKFNLWDYKARIRELEKRYPGAASPSSTQSSPQSSPQSSSASSSSSSPQSASLSSSSSSPQSSSSSSSSTSSSSSSALKSSAVSHSLFSSASSVSSFASSSSLSPSSTSDGQFRTPKKQRVVKKHGLMRAKDNKRGSCMVCKLSERAHRMDTKDVRCRSHHFCPGCGEWQHPEVGNMQKVHVDNTIPYLTSFTLLRRLAFVYQTYYYMHINIHSAFFV